MILNFIPLLFFRPAEEIMTMLLEASEEGAGSSSWDGGRIAWSVRYTMEGDSTIQPRTGQSLNDMLFQRQQQQQPQHQQHHHRRPHMERRKLQARLEIQKDDIQAVLPISKVTGK